MIIIHPEKTAAPLRALHGVNRGPVDRNWYFDLRPWLHRWKVPTIRTHDCIYNAYDTVDLHYLFPDAEADPSLPENYRFDLTDDLLKAMRDTGAEIYFRLGETIEHQPRMVWNRPERWIPETLAQVCVHIMRHYNEGWADGYHWNIRHWEFWNEPDSPKNWTGTPEQFFTLYSAVARAIKTHSPHVKVGTAGFSSRLCVGDRLSPWGEMLERCATEGVPLDFVSWHKYLEHWEEITERGQEVRSFLDRIGLPHVESHLGEWSYRPLLEAGDRRISVFQARNLKRYDLMKVLGERQKGHQAAALVFGALVALQDAPIDLAQYYCADTSSLFGLFDSFAVLGKRGMAFEAFTEFFRSETGMKRVAVECSSSDTIAIAATEGDRLLMGLASIGSQVAVSVKVLGHADRAMWVPVRVRLIDERHDLSEIPLSPAGEGALVLPLTGAGVLLVEWILKSDKAPRANGIKPLREPARMSARADGDW